MVGITQTLKFIHRYSSLVTLDLSEFNVNVMTGNNVLHMTQGLRNDLSFFVQTPEYFTSMELMIQLENDNFIEVKKILGSG